MNDARLYAVWPEPRSTSMSLKGSRPSVPHGTNFLYIYLLLFIMYTVNLDTDSIIDDFLYTLYVDFIEIIRLSS